MVSPTNSSVAPSPYISAVSITVMPSSMPARSAAISAARRAGRSPMSQVPCPSLAMVSPSGSAIVVVVLAISSSLVIRQQAGSPV